MKRLIALLAAVALVAAAFVAVPALAATKTVKVGPQIKFGPTKLSIKRGDTVKFVWTGKLPHNVRISKGPRTGTIAGSTHHSGYEKTKTFTRAGTYTIVCTIHQPDMAMKLRVTR